MSVDLGATARSLLRNRLQASLTLIGMSVGVAMVVLVSGLGLGAQRQIEAQLQSAGPTLITIRSGNFTPAGASSAGQEDSSGGEVGGAVLSGGDGVGADSSAASPNAPAPRPAIRMTRFRSPATALSEAEVRTVSGMRDAVAVAAFMEGNVSLAQDAGTLARVVHVNGFQSPWPNMQGWRLASGRWISEREQRDGAAVAILPVGAADRLWPDAATPLGQILKFKDRALTVVGTFTTHDADAQAVIPQVYTNLAQARALLGRDDYDAIMVRAGAVNVVSALAARISASLRELHELSSDTFNDFTVQTQSAAAMRGMGTSPGTVRSVHSNIFNLDQASYEEMARSLRKAGRTFSLLLAAGAAISLLVGGIGVMNIMLVSVTSRTREIGLRMAVGARTRDVLMQFLAEATMLATIGGLFGVLLGTLGLIALSHTLHWATVVSPVMLVLALLMAALTGVAFGYGPARRGAFLDPAIALRAE